MKILFNLNMLFVIFILFICGCVAGGATDPPGYKKELEKYPEKTHESIDITVKEVAYNTHKQAMVGILNDFKYHSYPVLNKKSVILNTNYSVSYYTKNKINNKFIIKKKKDIILKKKIPKAFYIHPFSAAKCTVGGKEVIICTIRSRSSTGRVFFGMYDLKGKTLHEKIYSSGDVWDIKQAESGRLVIGGARQTIYIGFKK